MEHLVATPCSAPKWSLREVLAAHAELGFRKFEAFIGWVDSALDPTADPAGYRDVAAEYGFRFTSMHLPAVKDDVEASLPKVIAAARFADALGADVVLYKAASRAGYIEAGGALLDAIDGLGVTAVVQNHCGSPLNDVGDVLEVLDGVGDERLKALLEVGHFHQAGVAWEEAYEALQGRIALVHVKDIAQGRPVPFGAGEIDFAALTARVLGDGYEGDWVVELEGEACWSDPKRYLREAVEFLTPLIEGWGPDRHSVRQGG